MKYSYNRYRNRYDYETRRSYRKQRMSDYESDSSSNNNSANNDLLREFINIKKSKEKVSPNKIDREESQNCKEKSYNDNIPNDTQNFNNQYMEMEQPTQIFSALKKPNFN